VAGIVVATFRGGGLPKALKRETSNMIPAFSMPEKHYIALHSTKSVLLLAWSEISHFEYRKSAQAWFVQTTDGTPYKLRKGVSAEQILSWSDDYVRANKGCVLNAAQIERIDYHDLRCTLRQPANGTTIIFSRPCYDAFCKKYAQ
jgi:hypothetical protein